MNLKQEFEQTKIFKLNKYIVSNGILSSNSIKYESQKAVHDEKR